jgi:hypothetical protein
MTKRRINAKQKDDEGGTGRGGAGAADPEGAR